MGISRRINLARSSIFGSIGVCFVHKRGGLIARADHDSILLPTTPVT